MFQHIPSFRFVFKYVDFWLPVSVFYRCITNYHKFISLKQHLIVSQFCRSEAWLSSLLRIIQCQSQGVPHLAFIWRLWEESTSEFIQVVVRIQFLALVGLRCLCSQLLEATHIFPCMSLSIFKPAVAHWIPLLLGISLTFPSATSLRKLSAFKSFVWLKPLE